MLGLSVSPKSKKEKNDRWIKPLNQGREGKNKALDNHLQYYFMEKRGNVVLKLLSSANQKPNEWKKTIMSGNFKSQILSPAGREESSFSFQSRKLNETLDTRSSNTKSFLIKENVKVTPVVPTISKITPNPADTTFDHSPSVDNRSSVSRNQTQRRTAFEDLISMFSGSSTKKPIKLFENSFFDTSRSNFTRKYLIPKSDSFIWDDIKESHKSDEKKVVDIVSIIPSLIKTSKMNNTQMLIKEFHQEIVQIKDFAWETIVNMCKYFIWS